MAELTINTSDIAEVLKKNLEGFKPDMSISQVGRILEQLHRRAMPQDMR